ncbi:MAG: sodium:solute symporter, partial [Firmicutes bacterium]|nr:sodium:solute symporter [Bacillota bacterium]
GENRDAMFYAARTFAFKLGQSIAMIIFTSLAVIGQYTENVGGTEVIRNTGAGYRISLIIAMILCLGAMAAIIFYDEDKVMGIIRKDHGEE